MKRVNIILLVLLGFYLLSGAALYFLQERLIFLDESLDRDYKFEFEAPFEEIWLTAKDGAALHGLHFKQKNPKGLILYFHGNSQSLVRWGQVVQYHHSLGYEVLIMDYRGYGKSRGKRSLKTLLSDALLWYDQATQSFPENQITVYGRSIGTGPASYVAGQNKPLRLILETPYYDMQSLVQRYYPIFPMGLALRFKFKNHEYVKGADCPVYIFHGTEDEMVPYAHAYRLYQNIERGKASMITIPGGEHKNLVDFELFREELEKVLAE